MEIETKPTLDLMKVCVVIREYLLPKLYSGMYIPILLFIKHLQMHGPKFFCITNIKFTA